MSHVYGPVPSRRLGRSLGIDVVPALPNKTCNYNCVYCQLGRTKHLTNSRKAFFPVEDLYEETTAQIESAGLENIDFFTFVGDGEPLLYSKIGDLIRLLKENYDKPVCIITNGSLLADPQVRDDIKNVDVIMPTLDAGRESLFKRINRPVRSVDYDGMIDGMIEFRKIFAGEIWIEYMAVDGLNDDMNSLNEVKQILTRIRPDRIYVNTPIRPPAEDWIRPPSHEKVQQIKIVLGSVVETHDINRDEEGDFYIEGNSEQQFIENLIKTIKRHPMKVSQVQDVCKTRKFSAESILSNLITQKRIKKFKYQNKSYLLYHLM